VPNYHAPCTSLRVIAPLSSNSVQYRFRRLESDKELPQVFSRVEALNDFSACTCQDNNDNNDINDVNAVRVIAQCASMQLCKNIVERYICMP